MEREIVRAWIAAHGNQQFSRSSGPGGQHVNTTASRVQLSIQTADLPSLTDEEKARLPHRMSVTVQDERSQWSNRETAVERLMGRLVKALEVDRPRKPTRPTRASKERRLTAKKVAASHRKNRSVAED